MGGPPSRSRRRRASRRGTRWRRPPAGDTMRYTATRRLAQWPVSAQPKMQLLETRDARFCKTARRTPMIRPEQVLKDERFSVPQTAAESGWRNFPTRRPKSRSARHLSRLYSDQVFNQWLRRELSRASNIDSLGTGCRYGALNPISDGQQRPKPGRNIRFANRLAATFPPRCADVSGLTEGRPGVAAFSRRLVSVSRPRRRFLSCCHASRSGPMKACWRRRSGMRSIT